MEDDRHLLAVLSCQDRARRGAPAAGGGREVMLSPEGLKGEVGGAGSGSDAAHRSSDCLVITIMELAAADSTSSSPSSWDSLSVLGVLGLVGPASRSPSLDSLPCTHPPAHKCRAWTSRSFPRCLLGALCMVSGLLQYIPFTFYLFTYLFKGPACLSLILVLNW